MTMLYLYLIGDSEIIIMNKYQIFDNFFFKSIKY